MSTILIMDDNKDYREDLLEILNLEGYITLEAENGLLGLQIIQDEIPDLILCDLDMPVMNGIEVLQSLRKNPKFTKISFLILSGNSEDQAIKSAEALDVSAYLIKGISITDLLSKIAYFLDTPTPPLKNYL